MDTELSTVWDGAGRILRTRLAGVLTRAEVERWRDGLVAAGAALDPAVPFRLLVDIRGYEVDEQDRDVHMIQREVVPLFLAAHGFRVGFFDLYGEEPPVGRDPSKAPCVAVAHVHHDGQKMDRYNELLARSTERFFTRPAEAEAWLGAAPEPARG